MRKWLSYLMAVAVAGAFLGCVTWSERGNTKVQVKNNPSGTSVKVHGNHKDK